MNNEIEDTSYEETPHGDGCEPSTLTQQRLLALCLVGVVMWAGIIEAVMFVWEML